MMRLSNIAFALLLLAPTLAFAEDSREEQYQKSGMDYAIPLYQQLDGSSEDETRARTADGLNYKIRKKAIHKVELLLKNRKDPILRRDLLKRLATLHQEQASVAQRRTQLTNHADLAKEHLHTAIRYLGQLHREFPRWKPDIILFEIAESYFALSDFPKAEKYYYEVIRRFNASPILADTLLAMGNLQFEKQRFARARDFYGKILRTPDKNLHPYAYYKTAWAFFNESNLNSAVASLETAVLESRKLQAENGGNRRLGVEDEALNDMVLFFAEGGKTKEAEETFQRLVEEKRAKELRFSLAKRLFEYGKHTLAKNVANDLLNDSPAEDQVNKLYLIVISSAEQSGEREAGLETAEKLSHWLRGRELASTDTGRIETEEYLRHYSQKLHYEAETLKRQATWNQAEKSYEIYLSTFDGDPEAPEVKFRYSVLLMHQKEHAKAYRNISEVLAKIGPEHKRFQDSMKLRVQSIELATKSEREEIGDKNLLIAYDDYVKFFPQDKLATEAEFKAARLAKTVEGPEGAAIRFQKIAERNPEAPLAGSAVEEALAVLVKSEQWDSLHAETKALKDSEKLAGLLAKNATLGRKVKDAEELSLLKIAEVLEKEGKYSEAISTYEDYAAASDIPDKIKLHSLIRATELAEKNLRDLTLASDLLIKLRDQFPDSKEGASANLELARLAEKMGDPVSAAKYYVGYAGESKTPKQITALTNAAAIYDGLGESETAAEIFFRLSEIKGKDGGGFYEAGCNNTLLAANSHRDENTFKKIIECADHLSRGGDGVRWLARKAWAEQQLAMDASPAWSIVGKYLKNPKGEEDRLVYAQARLADLGEQFKRFAKIRFSSTNEKPAANITKKKQALEAFERSVKALIKIGSRKQILSAQDYLKQAYLDFAETMDTAAMPAKLAENEKSDLKQSFHQFAEEFRKKADDFEKISTNIEREPASEVSENEIAFTKLDDAEAEKALAEIGKQSPSAYARYALHRFQLGDYKEARYYLMQWLKLAKAKNSGDETRLMGALRSELSQKFPDKDPMLQDLL